ncbi:hypothetical protein BC833DRAFT_659886 [Globomyces pollinis-pini]|nr:hypothetical protein BC833DRAFT_659886 [Globomyces pollinis-pini]
MEKLTSEIEKITKKIDDIERLLAKSVWTKEEEEQFGSKKELIEEEKLLRDKKKLLRQEELELLKQKTILLQREQNQGFASQIAETAMDIDISPFDSDIYHSKNNSCFPFFDPVIEKYLRSLGEDALLARDDSIKKVNHVIAYRDVEKYQPIICSTSRGMGKTAFLEAIGMQLVKECLQNNLILDAFKYGRILSFDFAGADGCTAIPSVKDIETFYTRLMIFFLCRLFDGTQVDGIHFEKIGFSNVVSFTGSQMRFNFWKKNCLELGADRMIDEYIRLTNIAFGVDCSSPPVFLLDEIQLLLKQTTVQSKFKDNQVVYHSFLSLLLTQLAGKHKPVCICAGTNSGNIINITERSKLVPQYVSLTTLHVEGVSEQFWSQRTIYLNKTSRIKAEITAKDQDLINSLVCASYQIPRLLVLAHYAWFRHRTISNVSDTISPLQAYEDDAIMYYDEIAGLLFNSRFTGTDIPHILLCCSVHWRVRDIYSFVPGTRHKWSDLITKSLVFPYSDNCYIIPFQLMWKSKSRHEYDYTRAKKALEKVCSSLIPNLDINNLFVSYDGLRTQSLYNLGMCYEKLFVSSLAVRYYLCKLEQKNQVGDSLPDFGAPHKGKAPTEYLPILQLYDIGQEDISSSQSLASILVDFSSGIDLPSQEVFVNSSSLPSAVIHNCNIQSAHHDIILPCKIQGLKGDIPVNIPVSCKGSFNLCSNQTIQNQLRISKQHDELVSLLVWLYLGNEKREEDYQGNVLFLNGDGCCNGLALDMFILTKKLNAPNNKS